MRSLNLDQLQALREIVALGSFSAAAQKLRLTQPAVSLQIRELEKRIGVRLIERMGKRAYATAAGEELVEHARRLAQDAEQALAAMRRHRDGWLGRVRLGTSVAVCTYLLPPMLVKLRRDYPDLEVVITLGTTENVVSRILANELDIGVVTMPVKENPAIEVEPLREDPMMAFFPGGERNLPKYAIPQYLAGRNLILNTRLSQTYRIIAGWFEAAGVEMRPIMELGNTEAIKTLVAAGIGVGILPLERKQGILVYGRTHVRPLRPALTRQLAIVRRQDKPLETGLKIVYEALLTLAKRPVVPPVHPAKF
ncbi:MAG TPA: LysR family transcriptional regulator [Burkholderiales bacterium]|nr:LysR family transcriptional regulator [Burkholderiales bacterium]